MVAEVTVLVGRDGRADEGVGIGSMVVGEAVKTGGGGCCCMAATPVMMVLYGSVPSKPPLGDEESRGPLVISDGLCWCLANVFTIWEFPLLTGWT